MPGKPAQKMTITQIPIPNPSRRHGRLQSHGRLRSSGRASLRHKGKGYVRRTDQE